MTAGVGKTDERSRARNRARWLRHVRAFAGSGLSVAADCRREGLQGNSFRRWQLVFRDSDEDLESGEDLVGPDCVAAVKSLEALFAEVAVPSPSVEASPIEVVLAGERRIRVAPGFDEETLRRVVAALEGAAC